MKQPDLLTLAQVAAQLRVSVEAVRKWVRLGYKGVKLRTTPGGRRHLVRPEWIEQFQAKIAKAKR